MRSGQVTIKDIARELGISPSTVSRALKDHPDISKKTKTDVKELAARLKYKPNAIALSLRSSKSNIIGVIIPEIVHFFFSSIISGIEDVANQVGYNVMICQSNETYAQEVKNTQALFASRVDGVLVSISKETNAFDHLTNFKDNGIPLVFFDRRVKEIDADTVLIDDIGGAAQAVEHLIDIGCKKIAHFAGPENLLIAHNRIKGYKQAHQNKNLPIDESLIIRCDSFKKAKEEMQKLIDSENIPDGIFAVNDLTAIGAMQQAKENGLKIPEDIAIVGFGAGLNSEIAEPTLSSVEQPGYEMGKIAAEILFERLADKSIEIETKARKLKTQLIVRNSSKRA